MPHNKTQHTKQLKLNAVNHRKKTSGFITNRSNRESVLKKVISIPEKDEQKLSIPRFLPR